jgi:hypothetical protein
MTRNLAMLSNLVGFGLTALVFLLGGQGWLALALFLVGGFWLYAYLRRLNWGSLLGLFSLFGFIAAGFLMALPPVPLFLAAFLSLAGWDLAGMDARLQLADPEEDTKPIQKHHFLRLGFTLMVGVLLVGAALTLHLRLSFELISLLAILTAWGLGRLISRLLKPEQR